MDDIDRLDIKEFVTSAITDVFTTMFSMKVKMDNGDSPVAGEGDQIVGSVSFAGEVVGNVSIYVPEGFAVKITAAMLGIEIGEVESDEEVRDAIGELCNMVGGDLKSRLSDFGFPCVLSIPTITIGSDFKIESKGWIRNERFGFKHREHIALVEVYLKSNK
jgi:chemotaxis protein CheX